MNRQAHHARGASVAAAMAVILSGTLALAQPANDECADAEGLIENGIVSGSTAGATSSGLASCSPLANDVWYAFNTVPSRAYALDVTSLTANTVVSILDGCSGEEIDDFNGRKLCRPAPAGGGMPTLEFIGSPDVPRIVIRVATDAAGGTFDLDLRSDAPSGGCCTASGCTVTTESNCAASGGSYLGDDTGCGSGPAGAPQFYGPSSPGTPIGPGAGAITEDTLGVSGAPDTIGAMEVNVDIEHFWLADLEIDLVHVASGTTVRLWDDQCGDNDDLQATFSDLGNEPLCGTPTTGFFVPLEPLSAFNGLNPNGDWTLRVTDDTDFEDGTLDSWSLTIDGALAAPCDDLPACPCDADNSGDVDVVDLLAYLALWFVDDEGAEADGDPGITVLDLLAFLNCWFPASAGNCG